MSLNYPSAWSLCFVGNSNVSQRIKLILELLSKANPAILDNFASEAKLQVDNRGRANCNILGYWNGNCLNDCWQTHDEQHITVILPEVYRVHIDHVAVVLPRANRVECQDRVMDFFGIGSLARLQSIQSIDNAVDFCSFSGGGIDVNVITPSKTSSHLDQFLARNNRGGILHIGLVVEDMTTVIEQCRAAGISLLSDKLKAIVHNLPIDVARKYESLIENGYAEEYLGEGKIRQTFVFPGDEEGGAFFELISRDQYSGYGELISPLLINGLDLVTKSMS